MNGLLLIDKPSAMTSSRVVEAARRRLSLKRIGHGGTLDPLGTGILPLLLGHATRFSSHFLEGDKSYEGVFRLGEKRDTDDVDGEIEAVDLELREKLSLLTPDRCESLAQQFSGALEQIPPQYSAIKLGGKKSYELARAGKESLLAPRRVTIYSLSLWRVGENGLGYKVRCSKGTYVRSLGRDLASALNTFAAVESLRRTAVGRFGLENAVALDDLTVERAAEAIVPLSVMISEMPRISLDRRAIRALRFGDQAPLRALGADLKDQVADFSSEVGKERVICEENSAATGMAVFCPEGFWKIRFLFPEGQEILLNNPQL